MFRIGYGCDVHRLKAGRKLILGGVEIPFEMGLEGHSDADVLCHAVADAILGASAMGDLGSHFPDTDPGLEGISSILILRDVAGMASAGGFEILNVDGTIVAQRPRIAPFVPQMRAKIAGALGIGVNAVSVKATTTEGLGFTGRGEGIAAMAVVLLRAPDRSEGDA